MNATNGRAKSDKRGTGAWRRAGAIAGVLGASAIAGGCGGSEIPQPLVFIGQINGTDARVGIIATNDQARLFFCGGPTTVGTLTHWFSTVLGASSNLTPDAGSSPPSFSVEGHVNSSEASGTITMPDSTTYSYQATPVDPRTAAGVYEANGACGKVGLLVAQSAADAPVATQGACVPAGPPGVSAILQVNPLLPFARAADGTILVTVTDGESIAVKPAAPPAG